jgi:hypothetical protein
MDRCRSQNRRRQDFSLAIDPEGSMTIQRHLIKLVTYSINIRHNRTINEAT